MEYTVSKEKGSSRYYVHRAGDPKNPIPGTFSPKKRALHTAAQCGGARILRAHDVAQAVQAARVTDALIAARCKG